MMAKSKERGPKVRTQVTIPADLVCVAKIESALKQLYYPSDRLDAWRLVGKRLGFKTEQS
jgi:hypothetical protein